MPRRRVVFAVPVASMALALFTFAGERVASAQLAPPPPMSSPGSNPWSVPNGSNGGMNGGYGNGTTGTLNRAEREDSGRGLEWVYVNAEAGASMIAAGAFSNDSAGLAKVTGFGPMFGVGAGVRLIVLTFGARFRLHTLSPFSLAQVNAEAGFHLPLGKWDPYVSLRGGYDFATRIGESALTSVTLPSKDDIGYRGFNVGLSGGADYYLSSLFSVGADFSFDTIFLSRSKVSPPASAALGDASHPLYATDGSTAGLGLSLSAHAGLHF